MWFLLVPGGAVGRGGRRGWGCGLSPLSFGKKRILRHTVLPLFMRLRHRLPLAPRPARISRVPAVLAGLRHRARGAQAEGRRDRSLSKTAARRRKKHGAGKQYVQNPQGIAVNSFLFEENLQLGNRPFYDLFGLVIGCGWSCAGSERFHGLFLISLANFPLHSAFREPQPLFF